MIADSNIEIQQGHFGGGSGFAGELRALVEIAEGRSRDVGRLLDEARRLGELLGTQWKGDRDPTNRAIYSIEYSTKRGPRRIEGATVDLIEALAQAYGYLLSRMQIVDVDGARITLEATVYDVLCVNVYSRPYIATISTPPGKFRGEQAARWESMQLQSAISKAMRTALQHALPAWYVQTAVDAAKAVIEARVLGGKSRQDAIRDMVARWAKGGVTQEQLENRVGANARLWTVTDLSELHSLGQAIRRGELTVAEAFPRPPEPPTVDTAATHTALATTDSVEVDEPEVDEVEVDIVDAAPATSVEQPATVGDPGDDAWR